MGHKILLADDSVTVQKIITLTFSDEGVDVVTVNNGDEAISRLQYLRPALVMADVSIPGRNGYEICEFVKAHPEMVETPVILLVPAFEPFDDERARRIGADYHLTKPFQSIRTLISTVKNLMERKPNDGFPSGTGGLIAVRGSNQNNSAPAEAPEIDSKRAKIEELIKLSAQPTHENGAEDESLLEVDLTKGDGRRLDSLTDSLVVKNAPDEVEMIAVARDSAIENYPTWTADAAAQDRRVSAESAEFMDVNEVLDVNDINMDNILELDDVLPDVASMRVIIADQIAGVQPDPPASAPPQEKRDVMAVPQNVIDEIVNRVSAQLIENLSGEIARRIAPEVAELVKGQLLAEPAVYRDSDNLLDID